MPPIWSGSCTLSQDGRWLREAHHFCISILDLSGIELCTTQKGRSRSCIRSETFSPIPLWLTIRDLLRPQATQASFQRRRPVPQLASAHIQCWTHLLSAYDYTIAYRPGSDHANADLLSRLPLPEAPAQVPVLGDTILLVDTGTPVTASHIRTWTLHDQVFSTVLQKVQKGWKGPTDDVLQPYARRKDELSVQDDVSCGGIESLSHHKVEARSLMSCTKVTQG